MNSYNVCYPSNNPDDIIVDNRRGHDKDARTKRDFSIQFRQLGSAEWVEPPHEKQTSIQL